MLKTRKNKNEDLNEATEPQLKDSGDNWQRYRKALAAVLIAAACAIGFVLMPMANKQSTEQAEIVQAADNIPENTVITEDMITTVKIPAAMLPETAVQDVNAVVGMYAQRRIEKQDYITQSKVGATPAVQEVNATADKMIISMTVPTAAAGVSGMLEIGDLVSVWSVPKETNSSLFAQSTLYTSLGKDEAWTASGTAENPEDSQTPATQDGAADATAAADDGTDTVADAEATPSPMPDGQNPADVAQTGQLAPENVLTEPEATLHEGLEFVEVAGIYSSTAANTEYVGPDIPVTVSLYVTKEQAQKLVEVEHFENLHFVFAARGDNRAKYLDKEDIIIW